MVHDGQDGGDAGWDWERPFDEDVVRGARSREQTGQERADRAARIAGQHRVSRSWRSDLDPFDTHDRDTDDADGADGSPPRTSRRGLLAVLVLLVTAVVLVATGVLGGDDPDRRAVGGGAPATAQADPSVATGAQPERLLPLPPAVPGRDGYRFSAITGAPGSARWDPCRPVRYVVRNDGSPRNGGALVQEAFARLSQVTGLRFVSVGQTTEDPSDDRSAEQPERYGPGFAPVLVAWSDPAESPLLAGAVAGYAGPVAAVDGRGARLVSGQVVLDAPAFRGFRARDEGRGVLLHELAHLMGLDHVDDDRDIMNAESEQGSPITDYTPGALRGLRLLGAGDCAA